MIKYFRYQLFIFLLLVAFISCREEETAITPGIDTLAVSNLNLKGYVQKGPFINGTAITISEMDKKLSATGKNFNTQIIDNKGAFSIKDISLKSEYVQLKADGFYFDEVKGEKSAAQLTMYALADVSDVSSVNVNLLSHLEKDRVMYLIQEEEKSFAEAKKQAEQEILAIFGIIKEDIVSSERLDISQEGEDNAILLAISAILQGNNTVAELSELLANIITDIREDGTLDSESSRETIRQQAMSLNLPGIRSHLVNRYEELGVKAAISNFEKYIDSDGDDILNKDEDDTPEEFTFTTQNDVAVNTEITSNEISISGLKEGGISDISVDSGQMFINGNPITATTAQVRNGDKVKLTVTSSSEYADTVKASLTVGYLTNSFTVVTDDYKPDDFSFTPIENAKRDSMYVTSAITLSGLLHTAPISLDQGILLINDKEAAEEANMVKNGDQVAVKIKASSDFVKTISANLQVGSISKSFQVTTLKNPWQKKSIYAGDAVLGIAGFSIGNKIYIGTGQVQPSYDTSREFYEYNPDANTWTRKADLDGLTRSFAASFSLNNTGYIGIGKEEISAEIRLLNDVWKYSSVENKWVEIPPLPTGKGFGFGFELGGKGYVGITSDYEDPPNYELWELSSNDQWSRKNNHPFPGGSKFLFAINNKAYFHTGETNLWIYDQLGDSWTQQDNPYEIGPGFNLNGTIYASGKGGWYQYDSINDAWKKIEGVTDIDPDMCFSINGKGYCIGATYDYNNDDYELWEFTPSQE